MKLTEQITRMKQIMGLRESRNLEDKEWLINWFSKVPQQKLEKTFKKVVFDIKTLKFKLIPIIRDEILKVIKNVEILYINRNETPEGPIGEVTYMGIAAFYYPYTPEDEIKKKFENIRKEKLKEFDKEVTKHPNMKKGEKEYFEYKERYEQYVNTFIQKYLDWDLKVNGKIVIFKDKVEDFTLSHEVTHTIYDLLPHNIDEIISTICPRPCNDKYLSKKTEIYSFLMEFRGLVGLEPSDIITDVSLSKIKSEKKFDKRKHSAGKLGNFFSDGENVNEFDYEIRLDVLRGNEKIKLPKNGALRLPLSDSPMAFFECCGNDKMEQVIMQLHNNLAKNAQSQNNYKV